MPGDGGPAGTGKVTGRIHLGALVSDLMKTAFLAPAIALVLSACTLNTVTVPSRSATEEMSISTAADRAADKLAQDLTAGGSVFVDATYFDAPDAKYAIGAIRAAIVRRGTKLAADRAKADRVVEIR